jgi:flagellar protein FliO/FliZ
MNWLDWVRAFFALGMVLGLIAAAAYGARRLGMLQAPVAGGKRRMSIVESLFLDPRRRLVIIRVDDQDHVLLLSPFGDKTIAAKPALVTHVPSEEAPT